MALVPTVLEAQILAAFKKQANKQSEGDKPEDSQKELAADLAAAIDTYIKTATVTSAGVGVAPGAPIIVTSTTIA